MSQPDLRPPVAPEAWPPAHRAVERLLRPIERFLRVQAASGLALLAAAVVALVWANSPFRESYEHVWRAPITVAVGPFVSTNTVLFWINDGLMVVFFFVAGLEIRREIHQGELSELRRAALPVVGALGGMIVPALLFLSVNHGLPSQRGWGVPMATDIAFAVGVLSLLGERVPTALRVLLLALAIIDDIGAIVVIALFYSSGISIAGIVIALGGVGAVLLLQRAGVRSASVYALPGFAVWLGCLRAGIHPTIAGVILGLLTPPRAWFGERGFVSAVRHAVETFRGRADHEDHRTEDLLDSLDQVRRAHREAISPVVRLQGALHPWVAFVIMPLFALANAGVTIGGGALRAPGVYPVVVGVVVGLVVGKPIGILAFSYLATRLGLTRLPAGVDWRGIGLVGTVAGIGFTMAIFIADLAFGRTPSLNAAKLAVFVASVTSGIVAGLVGRLLLRGAPDPRSAATTSEAESSTER